MYGQNVPAGRDPPFLAHFRLFFAKQALKSLKNGQKPPKTTKKLKFSPNLTTFRPFWGLSRQF